MAAVFEDAQLSSALNPTARVQASVRDIRLSFSEELATRLGEARAAQWFGPQTALDCQFDRLVITVPNAFIAQWISSHFMREMEAAARLAMGLDRVEVCVGQKLAPVKIASPWLAGARAPGGRGAVSRGAGPGGTACMPAQLNPFFTLDMFICGVSNRMARHAAEVLAATPEQLPGPLFIHGHCGLGKTHLLQGICRAYAGHFPKNQWLYLTAEQFTNEFLEAIKKSSMSAFRRRMRRAHLLVVDDVHFLARKVSTQQEFLHTFNELIAGGNKVVMAADTAPREIPDVCEALATRFISGMVVRVDPPDTSTKLDILRQLARQRGWVISDVMISRLSQEPLVSVRELEGLLTQAVMRNTFRGAEAGAPTGHGLAEPHRSHLTGPRASFDAILRCTAEYFGEAADQMINGCRSVNCSRARGVAMYLARELGKMSYPEISRHAGIKSHSTVISACQRIAAQIASAEVLIWKTMDQTRSATTTEIIGDITSRIRQGTATRTA